MPESKTGQPKIHDLVEVRQGKGWHVGELRERHKTFRYLEKGALVGQFASPTALLNAIIELKWEPQREKSSDARKDGDFQTFNSLSEAIDVFTNNPKSIRSFSPETLVLKDEENIGREITYDVTGDYLDIGRFLDGEPECFGVNFNGNPAGLHVTMYADTSAIYHVKKQAIAHKQARMLRLVDWMEQQGVRCRVVSVESTECGHFETIVKDYGDAVNLNDIAVSMHPDWLRRVLFLADEQSKTWDWGYGSAIQWTNTMKRSYVADPDDGLTVFISSQTQSDLGVIDQQFDRLRDKIATLLSGEKHDTVAGEETIQRDFTKVYAVEI